MVKIIPNSIKQKRIHTFNYHGHFRVIEPHVLGLSIVCYKI